VVVVVVLMVAPLVRVALEVGPTELITQRYPQRQLLILEAAVAALAVALLAALAVQVLSLSA
jgi:hypothetical protein